MADSIKKAPEASEVTANAANTHSDETSRLTSFARAKEKMIATNDGAYQSMNQMVRSRMFSFKEYDPEQIADIIASGSLPEQQKLSRTYFHKDGYYKQIINYYSNLLMYMGLLIPNPGHGKSLSTSHIQKKYFQAMDFVDRNNFPIIMANWMQKAFVDGCYYGVRTEGEKGTLVLIDLPSGYCVSRFKDVHGNDIIEFDLSYFNTITNKEAQKAALTAYPKVISKAYQEYSKHKRTDKWFIIPSDIGVCFPIFDGRPPLLNIIPASIRYDEAVETERAREEEEIRKILVQKIPHLTDGRLLFEPDEAEEIHAGSVGMLRKEKNISVLTTYGEVTMLSSKTSADNADSVLKQIEQSIYAQGGVSSEIFASTGSSSLDASKKVDLAFVMSIANRFAAFITKVINGMFGNSNVTFKYMLLPITWQNQSDYIENAFKLVGLGYSILLPAAGMGLNQKDLIGLKELENDVLKLGEKLIPLSSSYTQTNNPKEGSDNSEETDEGSGDDDSSGGDQGKDGEVIDTNPDVGGRPKKKDEQKAEQTIANEKSK